MEISIPDENLRRIASDPSFSGGYGKAIVKIYRQTLQILCAVPDETILAKFSCLDCRKGRGHRRKLAITEDVDLIVRIQKKTSRSMAIVEEIRCNGRVR